jgi:hypothetical protein
MYKLKWPEIDINKIFTEINKLLQISYESILTLWDEYKTINSKYKHASLGEFKTLNSEEAFIIFIIMKLFNIRSIVEIGTLLGKSTRRLIDIKNELKLPIQISCYDIVNKVKYFKPNEAVLNVKDITKSIKEDVINNYEIPGLIYLDAHPYDITRNTINEVLSTDNWILAIHDCGAALCNPNMSISKDNPGAITSLTGHWERYVLSEIFGINDPLNISLNAQETATHKMCIFSTTHGLCIIIPKAK